MGRSLLISDQSHPFDVLWNTSDQSESTQQVISEGYKRSTPFNIINVGVFHSFLCVIHFLPVRAPTLVRRPELICIHQPTAPGKEQNYPIYCESPLPNTVAFDSWTAIATSWNRKRAKLPDLPLSNTG